jgi:tetratricopeptide (TPR) repeat protein
MRHRRKGQGSVLSLRERAKLLSRLGRPSEAIAAYRVALERRPDDAASALGLAYALLNADDRAGAATEFRRLLSARPDTGAARAGLAVALDRQGRYADAARTLSEDERDPSCQAHLAYLLACGLSDELHRPAQALALAQAATAGDPDLPEAWDALAVACLASADHEGAKAALERLRTVLELRRDPDEKAFLRAWDVRRNQVEKGAAPRAALDGLLGRLEFRPLELR